MIITEQKQGKRREAGAKPQKSNTCHWKILKDMARYRTMRENENLEWK